MNDESDRMGPAARALIDSGRTLDSPDDRDRARIRARLTAALGVSALSAAGSQAAAASLATEGAAAAANGGLQVGAAAHGATAGASIAGKTAVGVAAGAGSAAAGGAAAVVTGKTVVGIAAGAGSAAAGGAAANLGAAAMGAGAVAVSGGVFGALGTKLLVASVVTAAAVSAAIGTTTLLQRNDANPAAAHVSDVAAGERRNARSGEVRPANPSTDRGAHQAPLSSQGAVSALAANRALDAAPQVHAASADENAKAAIARRAEGSDAVQRSRANSAPRGQGTRAADRSLHATGAAATRVTASTEPATPTSGALPARRPDAERVSADARSGTNTRASNLDSSSSERTSSLTATPPPAVEISAGAATPAAATNPALNATPTTASATGAGESSRPLSAATNDAATGSPESAAKLPALSGELKLLASAQQALRDDQLPRALTLLNEHATRYPRGALRPERLAARAVALCRMGEKNAGRAEAQKLATETPSSPLIRWARSICGL